MNALARRVRRLQRRLVPQVDLESQRLADLIRERRHRRLEAAGQPYEELAWDAVALPPGKRLSIAETLQIGRKLAQERTLARAAQLAK